jgi:uncharacterized protein (TIGR03790 family)
MRATSNAIFLALAGTFLARSAQALAPEDIAVIFNTKSPASLQVARYYLNARHLPQDHLIPLTCDVGESVSENFYNTSVVPQLKKALAERKLLPDEKAGIAGIRCLVTTYDVPLKIQAHELTAAEKVEVADDEKRLDEITDDLTAYSAKFDQLAPQPPSSTRATASTNSSTLPSATSTTPATAPKPTWRLLLPKVQQSAREASARIDKLPEPQRSSALRNLALLLEHVGGPATVMTISTTTSPVVPVSPQNAALAEQVREGRAQIQALMPQRDSPRIRREIVAQHLKIEGVAGEAAALEDMIHYVRPERTGSCFDNELALLLADQSYPREGGIVNPKSLDAYAASRRGSAANTLPTLMVCRLDGASPVKVQEMIDTGLKVEAKGLTGKMYIDARGLHGTDPYAAFDEDLRQTAAWMKAHSTMDTVLEDTPALLKAQDAPDAAVYCGWYSVGNYQESGQWVKGAVGYHVASFEMVSLHNPGERGWVVNLLNRGFCGTLGPTDEPFLQAFPKPSQFFPLLLSGEFTQGEVWELTCPSLSWRVGYVGDPLYNPFKSAPVVKPEDVRKDAVLKWAYEIEGKK